MQWNGGECSNPSAYGAIDIELYSKIYKNIRLSYIIVYKSVQSKIGVQCCDDLATSGPMPI